MLEVGMAGCSLHEAFPDTAKQSGKSARNEERRKASKCKGPALTFLKSLDSDPDRYGESPPLPPAEQIRTSFGFKGKEGLTDYEKDKKEDEKELVNNLIGQHVNDVIGGLPKQSDLTPRSTNAPTYFGKAAEDSFADFNSSLKDNPGYQLQGADFTKESGFIQGLDKAAGSSTLPIPSVKDVWKPLTPSGANSSFFEYLPPPGGLHLQSQHSSFSKEEKDSLLKKLDTLFSRLEELESNHNDHAHTEVALFILSGLFLMFGIELVRKIR